MAQPYATFNARQINADTSLIEIHGEVTAAAETNLMEAYNQVNTWGARNLLLDFTNLEYMNSSGIGLLVTLLIRAKRQNQRLLALGLSEHYRQIFELTRLNEAIGIYTTQAEALQGVTEKA